jgi:hypothetical protein
MIFHLTNEKASVEEFSAYRIVLLCRELLSPTIELKIEQHFLSFIRNQRDGTVISSPCIIGITLAIT